MVKALGLTSRRRTDAHIRSSLSTLFPFWHNLCQHQESSKMKKLSLKFSIVAMSLAATLLFGVNAYAQFVPALTYYAAGSSAMFNTMALSGGINVFGGGPLCGTH